MNQYIKRGGPVDAGLQTMRLTQRVTSPGTYFSPINQNAPVATPACETKSPAYSDTECMPVKMPCVGGACSEVSSIAATPYIYVTGCPIPYMSTTTTVVGGCECYQSVPSRDRYVSQQQACRTKQLH